MMILLSAKVLIPVVLILTVAFLLYDWKKTTKFEQAKNKFGFKRFAMAWWIKTMLNICFIYLIFVAFLILFQLGREVYNGIKYQEPIHEYSLPISFKVKPENREHHLKLENFQEIEIYDAQGKINIKSHTSTILFYIYVTINAIYVLTVLYQLGKFFQSLSEKQPFIKDNARRLRIVASVIMICELLQGVVCHCCNAYVHSLSEFQHFEITFSLNVFNLDVVFIGFILIVIAETFRCGAELKEENDLTV